MAHDIYLSSCVENPPDVWNRHYVSQTVINKPARDFVKDRHGVAEDGKKTTWEICDAADKEYRKNSEGSEPKRRLVSLYEATNVSERVKHYGSKHAGSQVVVNGGVIGSEVDSDPSISNWLRDL